MEYIADASLAGSKPYITPAKALPQVQEAYMSFQGIRIEGLNPDSWHRVLIPQRPTGVRLGMVAFRSETQSSLLAGQLQHAYSKEEL